MPSPPPSLEALRKVSFFLILGNNGSFDFWGWRRPVAVESQASAHRLLFYQPHPRGTIFRGLVLTWGVGIDRFLKLRNFLGKPEVLWW